MCDRFGPPVDFEAMRSGFKPGRRGMLRATAASALTIAVGPGLMGHAHAQGATLKATHGTGFCNLNFFLAHALQLARQDGTEIQFINTPTSAEMVTFLGMGQVDLGLMPYTSFMALFNAGAPVKVIAGGGVEGCSIVARPGLDSAEKLRGKTLGTVQLDTLEVLPYDYLKKHGISMRDVTVRYMGNTPEAVEAFKAGALDWICTIEPYATALINDVPGAVRLSDGTDIYGPGYTDCVLATRASLIQQNPQQALDRLVGDYYKTSMANAQLAMQKQPAVVDARSQTDFILSRTDSLMEMGYIRNKPGRDAIDWTLLEQVIAENQDIYRQLRRKSA